MHNFRFLLRFFFVSFGLFVIFGLFGVCFAQQNAAGTDKMFTADILKAAISARTDEELAFCDRVVQLRDEGVLPARIVYGVYIKAVTKEPSIRFAYFKNGLKTVCKHEGISLELQASPAKKTGLGTWKFFASIKSLFQRTPQ